MPTIEKLSIALPTEMASLVRQAVDAGEYSSQSEVVRDALRDWTYKRNLRAQGLQELRRAWLEAVADDSDGEDPAPILDALEHKYVDAGSSVGTAPKAGPGRASVLRTARRPAQKGLREG